MATDTVRNEELKLHLEEALQSFRNDPADSDYQRGYLAAIQSVYDWAVLWGQI